MFLLEREHYRNHYCAIRPAGFDTSDFFQIGENGTVAYELDIVKTLDSVTFTTPKAVAGAGDVDDRRIDTQGFPDHTTPTSSEGPLDIDLAIRRRS